MCPMAVGDAQGFIDALEGVAVDEDTAAHLVDGVNARSVAYPSTVDELSRVLQAASQQDMAVAPWGGGTRVALGNAPERLDVVVDLSSLDRVVDHNPADLTTTVQAGMAVGSLQEVLGQHGQFLALDPPLPHRATVGGTLAAGVSGCLKWQYGSPRDVVIGMKVVQADGKVTKSGGQVVKNVSGYDMARLHVGGLGTLGIIAEVSFKLTPLPADQATVVAAYETIRQCFETGLAVFQSDVTPLALTAFDGSANDRMGAVVLSGSGFLAIRLGGRPQTLERQLREFRSVCGQHETSQIETLSEADALRLWRHLADFGWDENTTPALGARVSLMPSRVPALTEALQTLERLGTLEPAIVAHPAHGTVLISWFAGEGGPSDEEAAAMLGDAKNAVHQLGGSMIIERCPSDVKSSLDVWDDVGDSVAIMRRLKEQYDPKRILNPGRFVGGI